MSLLSLSAQGFRHLNTTDLTFLPEGIHFFYGQNGSGKTSLLETIYYLATGKSFRTPSTSSIIAHQKENFSLYSQIFTLSKQVFSLGMERYHHSSTVKLNGNDAVLLAEIAALLPIRLLNSQSQQLLEAGPHLRRKFLDWGLFYHQSNTFLTTWRSYERALKHRNILLKNKASFQEIEAWTHEMLVHGSLLHAAREDYLQQLHVPIVELAQSMLSLDNVTVQYESGWETQLDLASALGKHLANDLRVGYSTQGPHRADFDILIDGFSVKHFLSRGQQKLLVCAMILAQGILLLNQLNRLPMYLIDDFSSELDEWSQGKLIQQLTRQPAQMFITAIDKKAAVQVSEEWNEGSNIKMFHVKHGAINSEC